MDRTQLQPGLECLAIGTGYRAMTTQSSVALDQESTPDRIDFPLVRLSLVLVFAAIIALLDMTVVNVAIDQLAVEFEVSLATIQWVSTGYLLAVAVAIPIAGWAIDRFGGRKVWLSATTAFLAGSMLAGLAWNAPSLIVFRVLQGLGGGMIEPVVMAMLVSAVGPKRIGRAMSLMLIPINLGPVIGPIVGGLIVDEVNWRWIFLVNLPLGIVALWLGRKYIPEDAPRDPQRSRFDLRGVLLLPPGFALVVYALTASADHGSIVNAQSMLSLAVGILLLAAYVAHALRMTGTPLLDVRLFSNIPFVLACLGLAMVASIGFATVFLLPLYYQQVHGASALEAGLLVAPFGVGAALGMAIAGRYGDRFSARGFGVAGGLLLIVSSFGLAGVERDVSDAWIGAFTALRGFSIALVVGPMMANAYRLVKADLVPRATTAMYIVFQLGASLGVAASAVVLQRALDANGADGLPEAYGSIFLGHAVVAVLILAAVLGMSRLQARNVGAEPATEPAHVQATTGHASATGE
jgi:EmrB/QacA subfamily drug resistance transporter